MAKHVQCHQSLFLTLDISCSTPCLALIMNGIYLCSALHTIRTMQDLLSFTLRMSVMVMMPYGLLMVIPLALADAGFQWSGQGVIELLDVMVINQQQTLSPLRRCLSSTLTQSTQESVILKDTLHHLGIYQMFG